MDKSPTFWSLRKCELVDVDGLSKPLDPQRAKLYQELASMRRLAFAGVSVSAIACLVAVFLVPFLHMQIQYMQSMAQEELHFCRTRTTSFWKEIGRAEEVASGKNKRATNIMEEPATQCCGCGIGKPGIAGLPGPDGKDGRDGEPGTPGVEPVPQDFPMPAQLQPQQWCFMCEEAAPGPRGPPGLKGARGRDGIPGVPGGDGFQGRPGMIGIQGPPGAPGLPGMQGRQGMLGQLHEMPGPMGPPGQPGEPGVAGAPGLPGEPGRPGEDGQPGEVGDQGAPGKPGADGEQGPRGKDGEHGKSGRCDHCPVGCEGYKLENACGEPPLTKFTISLRYQEQRRATSRRSADGSGGDDGATSSVGFEATAAADSRPLFILG